MLNIKCFKFKHFFFYFTNDLVIFEYFFDQIGRLRYYYCRLFMGKKCTHSYFDFMMNLLISTNDNCLVFIKMPYDSSHIN